MNDPVTPSSKPQAKPNASPMQLALHQAVAAAERGEVPVGAVITDAKGYVIAANGNRIIEYAYPTEHAVMLVIRE